VIALRSRDRPRVKLFRGFSRTWIDNQYAIAIPEEMRVPKGHTVVFPRSTSPASGELRSDEQTTIWDLSSDVRSRLLTGLKPDAFEIAVNDCSVAGQTVEHAHVHVSPRRKSDVRVPLDGIRWISDDKVNYWKK